MEIKCDYCGKTFEYTGGEAHYERSEYHYCSRACQNKANNLKQGNNLHGMAKRNSTDKRYKIWCGIKKRAKNKGLKFELDPDDIPKIPDRCSILDIKIKENDKAGPIDSSPSLDRINSNKGYIPNNIRIISNRANRLRQDATLKEMKLILEDMKNHE